MFCDNQFQVKFKYSFDREDGHVWLGLDLRI